MAAAVSSEAASETRIIDGDAVELVADCRYMLGEGSIWHEPTGKLLHVDIEGKIVGLMDPETGDITTTAVPSRVGTVVPVDGDAENVVVCLEDGAHKLNLTDGSMTRISADPEADKPLNRFNDGKCDPTGRLWAGTMNIDPPRGKVGTLYRFDAASEGSEQPLAVVAVEPEVCISNGIVWTSDGSHMLYIDTPTRRVDIFDYDAATGAVSGRREAFSFPESEFVGWPDGCTLDTEGHLWVAHFGGGEVTCIDVASKSVLARIKLPGGVTNVTSVAFGGNDLGDLYITTAREGLTEEANAKQPTAGGIFRVAGIGATGVPPVGIKLP
jgi:sugar lactone lactonase YvrE